MRLALVDSVSGHAAKMNLKTILVSVLAVGTPAITAAEDTGNKMPLTLSCSGHLTVTDRHTERMISDRQVVRHYVVDMDRKDIGLYSPDLERIFWSCADKSGCNRIEWSADNLHLTWLKVPANGSPTLIMIVRIDRRDGTITDNNLQLGIDAKFFGDCEAAPLPPAAPKAPTYKF